jgi:sterol desaturase/sphingolipid hydroxylase (fatty acid hydroxylase superfamily)
MTAFGIRLDASLLLGLLFAATFLGMALWESLRPSRAPVAPLNLRWFGNIAMFGLAWLIARLLPFLSSYGAAVIAARHGWGLFHMVALPSAIALAASFVLLDFFAYWTHRLEHKIPLLWRLHALHHSDTDLDVTTTVRHHPVETLMQMAFDAVLALVFGFPPEAIALYAGTVLVVQTFHHGNVVLPSRLCWLGRWLITPDLHRLHHSMAYAENNSNFGNLMPLWDWLFGTLRHAPEGEFKVGLAEFSGAHFQRFDRLLIQPFAVVPVRRR